MKHILKFSFNLIIILSIFIFFSKGILAVPINAYIDNVTPSMNAVSASKYTNITIVFTQPMDPSTINNANIKVFGYQTGLLTINVSYNVITKTASLDPNQDLKYGEVISITLTNRVKTITNESINPFVYSFTVQSITGTGIFTKTSQIQSASGPMKCGDIDGDNDIDLLINNKIYKNNGNAVFSFYTELSITGIPELADFDNDGDLDILINNSSNLYFYQNNGSGIFMQTLTFTGGLGSYGDLNGDGFLDISYFASVTDISTLRNNNGVFLADTTNHLDLSCFILSGYIDRVLLGDMDNDGDMDMLGISGYSGGNSITFYDLCRNFNKLTNNGSGRFISQNVYTSDVHGAPSFILSAGDSKLSDFDNDGYIDIATPGVLLKNNIDGSFSEGASLSGFCNLIMADLNGDGFIDLSYNIPGASLFTSINNGTGNFTGFIGYNSPVRFNSVSGDFDNDGDIDVAIVEYFSGNVAILLNGDNPLPVELSSFTSSVNSSAVTLNWSTTTEENNSGFEIDRSNIKRQTSNDWIKIGFVTGNGSTNAPRNYEYSDNNLLSGKYKYRLKQIDFNGNYKYYNLSREVIIGIPEKFELSQNFPNPFNPNTIINYHLAANSFV
ncbi:MAG: FG-GAP-like repeat-containing protein, partial [Bacteroidota bacterium]|nr:FG-GAP-like repeat-containing protein [Bacteroidota bacterium]